MKSRYLHLTEFVYLVGGLMAAFMLGFMLHETMVESEISRIKKLLRDE